MYLEDVQWVLSKSAPPTPVSADYRAAQLAWASRGRGDRRGSRRRWSPRTCRGPGPSGRSPPAHARPHQLTADYTAHRPESGVWPCRKESNGGPFTCRNAPAETRRVRGSRKALAPLIGSPGSPMAGGASNGNRDQRRLHVFGDRRRSHREGKEVSRRLVEVSHRAPGSSTVTRRSPRG